MKLTGNALSMLLKRYRAVLGKCRTLNWLAGMVLAGGLVLGGVSGALAVTINDGDTTINNPSWQTEPLIISGGTITVSNGQSPAGSYLSITNGAVTISGTDGIADTSLWGYGGGTNPSAEGYANAFNTISGGTVTITNGNLGSSQNAGTGGANPVSGLKISGGTIIFNGAANKAALNVQSLTEDASDNTKYTANQSNLIITGGKITTASASTSGSIQGWNTTVDFSGGEINAVGTINLVSRASTADDAPAVTTTWNMSGGAKLTVAENGKLVIGANSALDGTTGSSGLVFNITGGTVSNAGTVQVGTTSITADVDLKLLGSNAAAMAQKLFDGMVILQGNTTGGNSNRAKLQIGDWVQDPNTSITLAAGDIISSTPTQNGKIQVAAGGSLQTPNLTLTGAALEMAGRIRVNTLTFDNTTEGLSINGGKINLHGLKNSALNGGLLTLNTGGTLDLGKDDNPGGNINANVKVNGGTMETSTGTWTLAAGKEINVTDGILTVGGSTLESGDYGTATLDVTKGTFTTSQYVASGSDQTDGTAVLSGGTLVIKKSQVYSTGTTLAQGFQKIHLADGGAITVTNVGDIAIDNISTFKQGLILAGDSAQASSVNLVGMNVTGTGVSDGTVTGTAAEGTGSVLQGYDLAYDVTSNKAEVGSTDSTGGDALKLGTGVSESTVVEIGKSSGGSTVTLLGGGTGSNLIQNADGQAQPVDKVSVLDDSSLNLGSAAIAAAGVNAPNQGGNLGTDVALGSSSNLNTQAGSFTVGAVDGATSGTASGTVAVSANGTLNAASVGATNGVDTVEVTDGGTLISGEGITTNTLTTNQGTVKADDLTINTSATVSGGVLDVDGTVTMGSSDSTFQNGVIANIGILDNSSNNKNIIVGTEDDSVGGTTLNVGALKLGSGKLLLDPEWGQKSSVAVLQSLDDTTSEPDIVKLASGGIGIGKNSMAVIGDGASEAWLREQLPGGVLSNATGGVTAALGLLQPLVLGNGAGVTVNGELTNTAPTNALAGAVEANKFTQANGTLLVISDAAASAEGGAIQSQITTGTASASIDSGAKLRIVGAQVGKDYTIFGEKFTQPATPWDDDNISTDNPLVTLSFDSGKVKTTSVSASEIMPKLDPSLASAIDAAAAAQQINSAADLNSDIKGVQFLSRALSENYLNASANPDLAAQTIEGAARMVTIGAVPQMTRTANQAAAEAVTQRTSMAIPSSIQTQQATDRVALWIMPLYQSTNGARLDAGNMDADYHGGLGGIALGADYTFANAIRAGIAFNIGAGYATGGGDFADTTNNMNFWGLGAYAGWTGNNIGVSADVNFTSAYNKLSQDLPQSMGMRDLKADVRSYAFSTGLRGEYKLETSAVDITPHVGVRFMYLTTDDYKVKSEGTVLKGDGLNQNIWTFPIGVSFSKNIERSNGWHVKPMLDLAVVPAAGDIKAKENVRFSGTDYKAELETQVMDYITYQGVLGLEVGNQNLTFGLSGNTQFGEKTSGYGVLGSFRYEF